MLDQEDGLKARGLDEEKILPVLRRRIFSGVHFVMCHYQFGFLTYWFSFFFTVIAIFPKR
jgi:hypothetical protein